MADRPISGEGWGPIVLLCLLMFPKLALGLSGFETGVAVMPLVRGRGANPEERLEDRIRGAKKLLLTAALIMCFYLLASSMVTATLIEPRELSTGGRAANRALAYCGSNSRAQRRQQVAGGLPRPALRVGGRVPEQGEQPGGEHQRAHQDQGRGDPVDPEAPVHVDRREPHEVDGPAWVAEHRVFGRPVLPAAAYVELCRAAGSPTGGRLRPSS